MRITPRTVLFSLIRREHLSYYLSKSFVPLRKKDELLIIGVTDKFTAADFVRNLYKSQIMFVEVSEKEIIKMLQIKFSSFFLNSATLDLYLYNPKLSSKSLYRSRLLTSLLLLITIGFFCFSSVAGVIYFIRIANIFFIANIIFKFLMLGKASGTKSKIKINDKLPTYSILLPLFKEKLSTLEGLVSSINNLNYPKTLLDVKLVVEQFDKETIHNLNKLNLPKYFQVICTKSGLPHTKPKACNYALNFVSGKYVVIYDAEDRPEKNQLLKAVQEFQESDKRTVCLQAQIGFYNRRASFLSAQMSIEYKIWFGRFLKFLEQTNSAVPLGGSSNHFKVKELLRLKGWDPYNVTEDADLGVRIHKYRFKTKMLNSITMEEGPVSVYSWVKQRSRWIKGHIATYCVHVQTSRRFFSKQHPLSFFYFHLFLLMPTLSFFYPIVSLSLYYISSVKISDIITSSALSISLWLIFCWYSNYICSGVFSFKKRIILALLSPLYYLLHSISSVLAIGEFIICPSYWRKTVHFFREKRRRKKVGFLSNLYRLLFN